MELGTEQQSDTKLCRAPGQQVHGTHPGALRDETAAGRWGAFGGTRKVPEGGGSPGGSPVEGALWRRGARGPRGDAAEPPGRSLSERAAPRAVPTLPTPRSPSAPGTGAAPRQPRSGRALARPEGCARRRPAGLLWYRCGTAGPEFPSARAVTYWCSSHEGFVISEAACRPGN